MEMQRTKDAREHEGQQPHASDAQDRAHPVYPLVILGALAVRRDGEHPKHEENRGQPALDVEDDAPQRRRLAEESACRNSTVVRTGPQMNPQT